MPIVNHNITATGSGSDTASELARCSACAQIIEGIFSGINAVLSADGFTRVDKNTTAYGNNTTSYIYRETYQLGPISPLLPLLPFFTVNSEVFPDASVNVYIFAPPSSSDVWVCFPETIAVDTLSLSSFSTASALSISAANSVSNLFM